LAHMLKYAVWHKSMDRGKFTHWRKYRNKSYL
jgi:hypothetical protein